MLGLKVNNEWLDLFPGARLELEENNPYMNFNGEIKGERSFPLDVPDTAKNQRLLKYAAKLQKRSENVAIDAAAYSNGQQHSIGKIKVEKANINLNDPGGGRISIFYLTGISYFWQDIKGKRLRDVDMGGARQFHWDNFNRGGNGFWGHIHKVVDAGAGYGTSGYDYAFYPVIRENLTWAQGDTDLLNRMSYTAGQITFERYGTTKDANVIVPFVYLKFVLSKIMENIGWVMTGDILDDPDFCKITMDNERAIDWAVYVEARLLVLGNVIAPRAGISFNLQDHVPDMLISEFLIAMVNRLGLWLDVDKRNKVVQFQQLKDVAATGAKNYTAASSPLFEKKILSNKRIFSLKTSGGSAVSLNGYSDQGTVANISNLPAPTDARDNQVYLVLSENNYYICQQKEGNNNWVWGLLMPNTGNYEPYDAEEEVLTAAMTAGVEKYNNYLDLIPRVDGTIFWPGRTDDMQSNTLVLLFFHGRQNNKAGQPYPFASHHIYNSQGVQVGNWALSYLAKKTDGSDVGLYHVQWKPFLDKLTTSETITVKLLLTLPEYLKLRFHDEIIVDGVRMYIAKKKPVLPYAGSVDLECSRI